MKKFIIFLTILVFAFCGGGNNKLPSSAQQHEHEEEGHQHEQEGEEHEHEGEESHLHEENELHVSPQKQKDWGIVVGSVTRQNIASRITLPGILKLNENRTAHVSSFVQGKIVSLSADLGDKAYKGKAMVTINSPEFGQAQANFLQARSKLNLSRREYERAKSLLQEKAIEEKEYLRREAAYKNLSTEYGALGSALHSYGLTHEHIDDLIKKHENMEDEEYKCEIANPNLPLLSPISGTVILRDAIVGEHVEPEKILFTISNLNTLWVSLDAYEKDLPYINQESEVTITSQLYPEKEFQGKIIYISDLIDEKLRTVKIRVEVENAEKLLKPNMYIQGIIENSAEGKSLLAIPEESIQNLNDEKIVFILEEKDLFAVRHIKLGRKVGDKRILISGLKEGEKIVIKGAFNLKAELSKAAFGHVHVH